MPINFMWPTMATLLLSTVEVCPRDLPLKVLDIRSDMHVVECASGKQFILPNEGKLPGRNCIYTIGMEVEGFKDAIRSLKDKP